MKRMPREKKSMSLVCAYCNCDFLIREYVYRKRVKQGNKNFYCCTTCRVNGLRTDPVARFWSKVDKTAGDDGCWLWTAGKDRDGYGEFSGPNGSDWSAHRYSYFLHNGEIDKNLMVCHSCDNPSCVNPKHLSLNTGLYNQGDMSRKGRHGTRPAKPGHSNAKSKLLPEQAMEIYKRANGGESASKLAREYGVAHQTIGAIRDKKIWKVLWE